MEVNTIEKNLCAKIDMGTGKSQALGPRVKWQLKNFKKIIKTLQNISKFHLKFFYKILKSRKLTQICHPTKCKIIQAHTISFC